MLTQDGFEYRDTPWAKRGTDKSEHYIKYGIGYWQGVEFARCPGVMTTKDWNQPNRDEVINSIDKNLVEAVNDIILEKLGWPPYDKKE